MGTPNYKNLIATDKTIIFQNNNINDNKCGIVGENIEHIMGGCPALAENAYLNRHNQLTKLVHQQVGIKNDGLLDISTPPYYKYDPTPVLEKSNIILYWDRPVFTDKSIDYNRPGILLINAQPQ